MSRARGLKAAVLAAVLVLVVALAWRLPVSHWIVSLAERVRGMGATGVALFIVVYVIAEVLLLPGSLFTLAAGFAYGPIGGLLVASPASVLAAAVAFLLGRTVLRGWIKKRIARYPKARALDTAVGRNSFKLILLLRLSPAIPFNILNYALGLSDAPVGRYVVASFIGMLPGTWMYVYLGSLATTAAGLTDAGRGGGPERLVLTLVGLAATVIVVILVTRLAQRALEEELTKKGYDVGSGDASAATMFARNGLGPSIPQAREGIRSDGNHDSPPPQIVCLHGLTGSKRFFAALEKRLRGGPTNGETFSFDLPGFGENRKLVSNYGMSDHVGFVTASIERHFPFGQLVLIGHSLGGVLALAWAVQYHDRVSRIILINTPLGDSRDDVVRSLLHERFGWGALLLQHRHMAHLACLVLRGAQVIRAFRFAKPRYVPDAVFLDYTKHSWKAVAQTFDRVFLGVPAGPLVRQIRDIQVLNLMGRTDDEISRRAIEQGNVHNVLLPGGHLMLLEHPGSTMETIERFLSDPSTSSSRALGYGDKAGSVGANDGARNVRCGSETNVRS